ncbi:MAG: insulinase family protein [Desulfobulbaceae bacterium]|nr:insulinase family protein [Desulfobulbaceae bacterium]
MNDFTIGSTYHGFVLERREQIPEIHSTVLLFTHAVLGCQAVAIKNQDPNKTFCVAFMTVPDDSTGVAHILEHSVLMGSQKYPVKDVFGEINKGGLMTFLNAMTGADTTWYPFATRNIKEYFNIMDVYCDVVFHPLLLQSTFEQEGWHYHLENDADQIQYKGVVLNEMKGAFSDPTRALFYHTFRGLMPESTYAHESGGDPQRIPELTYEQFVAFHNSHYHPSNSTFFMYGDAPLDQELAFLQDNFLAKFPTPVPKAQIKEGNDITAPVFIEESYPVQPGTPTEQKTFMAISSVVGTIHDRKLNAAFQIIANILFNSDGSPLKKAIFNASVCKDFGGLFLSNSSLKTLMITYLIGSDPEKREHFLALYQATLTRMVDSKLDRDLVLSELNKYEFTVREEMNKAQRGLDLISKALPAMKHQLEPFDALQIDALLAEIRHDAVENGYFEQLIRSYLLDNPATVTVTLTPDPAKMEENLREEQQRLETYSQSLDAVGRRQLIDHTQELMALQASQNSADELRLLPRLSLSDLDPRPPIHAVQPTTLAGTPLLISNLETNGICYLDFGLDCSALSADLLPYLDLFATVLTEIGTTGKDYMQFAKAINLCTGDFSHSFQVYVQADARNTVRPILWLHIKALSAYLEQAINLLTEVLTSVDFSDHQHIEEIIQREYAWAEHSVQSEGYSLASTRAFSHLSTAGQYNEYVHGIHAYQHLKHLAGHYPADEGMLLAALQQIRQLLFRRQGLIVSVTAEDKDIKHFQGLGLSLINGLPDLPVELASPKFLANPIVNQAFTTSAEIVYNVQACNLFPTAAQYNGSFEVLRTWLSRDYLWNTVRQMGGAYGCFIQFNHLTGNFGMVSYRDPQVKKTYEAYEALSDVIGALDLSEESLHQLIIGAYGGFNPHQGPASRGAAARNDYLSGVTPAFRQQRIEEILATSAQDIRSFAPLFAQLQTTRYRATIGNRERIEQDKALFGELIEI